METEALSKVKASVTDLYEWQASRAQFVYYDVCTICQIDDNCFPTNDSD
jgi:hypothetical protein